MRVASRSSSNAPRLCPLQEHPRPRRRHEGHLGSPEREHQGGGDNPVTCHLTISGEKGRLAFERMDKLYLEQTEDAFCQEADVEITIF